MNKKLAPFRKPMTPEEKLRLVSESRRSNFILGKPEGKSEKKSALAFLSDWFKKEIETPQKELAGIAEAWDALAPDYAKDAAQLISFKRGTLELRMPSAALKYRLDTDLRTGLQARLGMALKGAPLRKITITVGTSQTASAKESDCAEVEDLRREKLSEVMKAAESGDL